MMLISLQNDVTSLKMMSLRMFLFDKRLRMESEKTEKYVNWLSVNPVKPDIRNEKVYWNFREYI